MTFLLSIAFGLLLQQSQAGPVGSIEGKVVQSGGADTPLAAVQVKLRSVSERAAPFSVETLTDALGRFEIPNVPAGSYLIELSRDGFGVSSRRTTDPIITVSAGKRSEVAALTMSPMSKIHGRIVDAEGNPLSFINVEILRATTDPSGRKSWSVSNDRPRTDLEGEYRTTIQGRGDYYFRAIVESGASKLAVYYPETTDSSKAAPVVFAEGSDVKVDFKIPAGLITETHRMAGRIMLPADAPGSPFIQLVLTQRDAGGPPAAGPYAQTSARGGEGSADFEFRDVQAGNYELSASTFINNRAFSGKVPVSVRGEDLDGVQLDLHPPTDIRGRFVIEGPPQKIQFLPSVPTTLGDRRIGVEDRKPIAGDIADIDIRLDNGSFDVGRPLRAVIDPTGAEFSYRDLADGDYRLIARLISDSEGPGRDLYIEDVRIGSRSIADKSFQIGVDVLDSIEVVIGTKGGVLEGRVANVPAGTPVVLFLLPEASRLNNPSLARVLPISNSGSFRMTGIAPGNYQMFAVPNENELVAYRAAEFLLLYGARALSVTVQKGSTSGSLEVPFFSGPK